MHSSSVSVYSSIISFRFGIIFNGSDMVEILFGDLGVSNEDERNLVKVAKWFDGL